jgi:FHS family L-fucose permease-like MFS transporter
MTESKPSMFIGNDGKNYFFPFALVTSLFLLWGFAHSLLDILNKHFQDSLDLTKAQSGAVQASAYGAYFLMALPAGLIARRYGYKRGVLVGLALFFTGCFWFVPAVGINQFWAFLLGLLILFSGLTCLETIANPYTTVLGHPHYAASRINLAQTFNALGWILGPLVGSLLIFRDSGVGNPFTSFFNTLFTLVTSIPAKQIAIAGTGEVSNTALILPYVGLGVIVVLVAVLFFFSNLPDIIEEKAFSGSKTGDLPGARPLIRTPHFVMAVVAQFLYVAAQTGIGSFFVNYTIEVESLRISEMEAGILLGLGGMGLFALGRFTGSALMRLVKPGTLIGLFGLINTFLMGVVAFNHNNIGIIALLFSYLFMSIQFPSIFALGIRGLGQKTKLASSILVMTIVGGAICPALMGAIGENNMSIGFLIPLCCFAYISFFGFVGSKRK